MHQETGYLPEQPYFYEYLTAAEVLNYFARFHGLTATDRHTRVENMLKKVGLETAGKIQLRKYSKGMLQRVGLAQAILHDPQVVILDEPMSGLDPLGRREVRDIILELKKEGRAVLFSTHILSDAEMLCDRVGVIVGGKLRGVGTPGEMVGIKTQEWKFCSRWRRGRTCRCWPRQHGQASVTVCKCRKKSCTGRLTNCEGLARGFIR